MIEEPNKERGVEGAAAFAGRGGADSLQCILDAAHADQVVAAGEVALEEFESIHQPRALLLGELRVAGAHLVAESLARMYP